MPIVNGRLTCCGCGADLGFDADDPYADPDCQDCLRRSLEAEIQTMDDEFGEGADPWADGAISNDETRVKRAARW